MNWIRTHKGLNRMVVATLMVASVLTFVEHTCHMDIVRLFSSVCCCDSEQSETAAHHHGAPEHEMDHDSSSSDHADAHMGHGMNVPNQLDTSRHSGEAVPCSHTTSDEKSLADACCMPAMQAEISPTLVRVVEHTMELAIGAKPARVVYMAKPPPIRHLLQTIPIPRISWPPGYILFGAFLN